MRLWIVLLSLFAAFPLPAALPGDGSAAHAGDAAVAPAPATFDALPERLDDARIDELMLLARRWFEVGAYAEARHLLDLLVNHQDFLRRSGPRPADVQAEAAARQARLWRREAAWLLYWRCSLALAKEPDELQAVAQGFRAIADNPRRTDNPRHKQEARFHLAQAQLAAGDYENAARSFDDSNAPGLPPELQGESVRGSVEARRRAAEALPPNDPKRGDLLARAASDLLRAERLLPEGPAYDRLALDRAALLLARDQEDSDREAAGALERYLATHPPPDPGRARASLLLVQARRRLDDPAQTLAAADLLLSNPIDDPEVRRDAQLARARSAVALTIGQPYAARVPYLTIAHDAYAAALALAPRRDPRWETARTEAAKVAYDLGENAAALDLLAPLLDLSPWRGAAQQLAGDACRALHRHPEAILHYRRAALADSASPSDRQRALAGIAQLEEERGQAFDAAAWWIRAADEARQRRAFGQLAVALFGLARARVLTAMPPDLAADDPLPPATVDDVTGNPAAGDDGARLAAALGNLLDTARRRGSGTRELPSALREQAADLAMTALARRERELLDPEAAAKDAGLLLANLRRRQGGGLPTTLLAYWEARASFQAPLAAARVTLERQPDQPEPAIKAFHEATVELEKLSEAVRMLGSPPWSLAALCRDRLYLGRIAQTIESAYLRRNEPTLASEWNAAARDQRENALGPLETIAESATADADDRWRARWYRGQALETLGRHAEASREFSLLASGMGGTPSARGAAARRWAANLAAQGNVREAVRRLAPFVQRDPEAALASGKANETLGNLADAVRNYTRAAQSDPSPTPPPTPHRAAEAMYRLGHLLRDRLATAPGASPSDRAEGEALLNRLPTEYPASPWATQAAEEQALRLVASDPPAAARQIMDWRGRKDTTPQTRRVLTLALSQAYLALGDPAKAQAAADDAYAQALEAPDGRRDQARAELARAAVREARGELGQAMADYLSIYGKHASDPVIADPARLGVARVHLARAKAAVASGRKDYATDYATSARTMLSGLSDPNLGKNLEAEFNQLVGPAPRIGEPH